MLRPNSNGRKKGALYLEPILVIGLTFILIYAFIVITQKYESFNKNLGQKQKELLEAVYEGERVHLFIDVAAKLSVGQALYDVGQKGGQDPPSCGTYYGYALWTSVENGNTKGCSPSLTYVQQSFLDQTQSLLETYVDAKNSNEQFNFIPPNNYQGILLENGYVIGKADSIMNIVIGKGLTLPSTLNPFNVSTLDPKTKAPIIKKEEPVQYLTSPLDSLPFENEAIIRNGPEFVPKVKEMSKRLGIRPECLMKAMHFESKGFNPQAVNPKSKATGLIQFMPSTARGLGTSIEELYMMNGVQQLKYVEAYFAQNLRGKKINSCVDLYFVIFYPYAIGKPDSFVLGSEPTSQVSPQKIAEQNYPFDLDKNGQIKAGEVRAYKEQRGWA